MEFLQLLWHVPTAMLVLLAAGLVMGQRQIGELSVFDLLTGITIGTMAGAGIVDPQLPYWAVLSSILGLAALHWGVTWLTMKWLPFGRLTTFEPVVLIKDGQPIRSAMRRTRLSLSDLFPLLRREEVFDIREVKYGVLEPNGTLSVVRNDRPPAPSLHAAVIVDGHVEGQVLQSLGWDSERLRAELGRQGHPGPEGVFLATLSEQGELYAVPRGAEPQGPVIRH